MSASSAASSSLTRARLSVYFVSALVAASSIYYIYVSRADEAETVVPSTGLHRSNAIHRRRRRNTTSHEDTSAFLTDSSGDNDEDTQVVARLTDGETVVDDQAFQDDYSWNDTSQPPYQRSGQNIVQLLFRVSEDATRRNAYVHRGCACNSCNMVPIRGIRYRCANCADFDLCEGCESQGFHNKTHIFYKVKVPAPSFGPRNIQPVWYTGDPDTTGRTLPKALINKLSRETGFERPELDAYWEQWTFMANTDWREDPDDINLAMDRKTFERCLVPSGASKYAAPSLIFDRMFAFYDANKDDLIGFPEFLHGLAYRKKRDKWNKIFDGYDIDGDGYVDRKDFLRLFRSYYVLFRQMHRDVLEGMDEQQMSSTDAHRLVTSRQPLSGAFGLDGRYPSAPDPRTGEGKTARSNGDLEISDGKGIINESSNDTGNREDIFRRSGRNPWGSSQSRNSGGYWDALLSPAVRVEQLPDIVSNISRVRVSVADSANPQSNVLLQMAEEEEDEDEDGNEDSSSDSENDGDENDENWPPVPVEQPLQAVDEGAEVVGGSGIHPENLQGESRTEASQNDAQQEQAQQEINERWKRRQFYTDEEEGATAPADWKEDDDVLGQIDAQGESSKSHSRPSLHSRSSSKVRFAEEVDDFDTRSNPSTSSRSVPERWGGMDIPDAEKDAGKEILFQTTQQAFNELLDPLFKAKEDAAIAAAETMTDRAKNRHIFGEPWFKEWAKAQDSKEERPEGQAPDSLPVTRNPVWPAIPEVEVQEVRQRSLSELLDATGYTVEEAESTHETASSEDGPAEETSPSTSLREAINSTISSLGSAINTPEQRSALLDILSTTSQHGDEAISPTSTAHATPSSSASSYQDPTLPQFRPNFATDVQTEEHDAEESEREGSETKEGETKEGETLLDQMRDKETEIYHINPERERLGLPTLDSEVFASLNVPAPPGSKQKTGDKTEQEVRDNTYRLGADGPGKSTENPEYLLKLWKAEQAEKEREERGGWGRINYEEFEAVIKTFARADGNGNAMDYLGSWIEFCIP